jgi:hypothetical protein
LDFDRKIIIRNTDDKFRVQLEYGTVTDLDVRRKNQLNIDLRYDGINFRFVPVQTASPRTYSAGSLTFVFKIDHH